MMPSGSILICSTFSSPTLSLFAPSGGCEIHSGQSKSTHRDTQPDLQRPASPLGAAAGRHGFLRPQIRLQSILVAGKQH